MSRLITTRGFEATVARMAAGARRRADAAVNREMREIVNTARAQWPVSSGDSAGAFGLSDLGDDDVVSVEVRNTSGYAQYINRGDTYDDLIRRPWLDLLRRLPAMIESGDLDG